jgi:fructosamine-3-kinase
MQTSLATALSDVLGRTVIASSAQRVVGGSINQCSRFETTSGPIFVKHGDTDLLRTFEVEAAGLAELAAARAARIPQVLAIGERNGTALLVLEWIDLTPATAASEAQLGELLAAQHRTTQDTFGWDRDNTIGSTPQHNRRADRWIEFFRDSRLLPQLALADRNGAGGELIAAGQRLCERLDDFFADHEPEPSLLHGDLWGGNWGTDTQGKPVLFDPAVYFGDRETDLAMTRLFGGFGAPFYVAYQKVWPLPAGAEARITLYNLYHVLNHFNLFGGGYRRQAEAMIERLL